MADIDHFNFRKSFGRLGPTAKADLRKLKKQARESQGEHLSLNRQASWDQHKKLQAWTRWASWGTFMFFSAVVLYRWLDAHDRRHAFNFWRAGGSIACFAGFFFLGTITVELIAYLQDAAQSASDKYEVRRYAKSCDRARQNDYSTDWTRCTWLPMRVRRHK